MVALGANVAGPIGAAVMLAIAIVVWVRPARRRLAPAGAAPLSVETGTSTAGVRTPPITLP